MKINTYPEDLRFPHQGHQTPVHQNQLHPVERVHPHFQLEHLKEDKNQYHNQYQPWTHPEHREWIPQQHPVALRVEDLSGGCHLQRLLLSLINNTINR